MVLGGHGHGHGLKGINLTSVTEVFNKATLNVTRNLLQYVTFRTDEGEMEFSDASFVKINRVDECHILNLDKCERCEGH